MTLNTLVEALKKQRAKNSKEAIEEVVLRKFMNKQLEYAIR